MTQLLNKGNFQRNSNVDLSFHRLKAATVQDLVLALPNFKETSVVEIDVSRFYVGAMLMENKRPLAFFSQALPPTHRLRSCMKHQ